MSDLVEDRQLAGLIAGSDLEKMREDLAFSPRRFVSEN